MDLLYSKLSRLKLSRFFYLVDFFNQLRLWILYKLRFINFEVPLFLINFIAYKKTYKQQNLSLDLITPPFSFVFFFRFLFYDSKIQSFQKMLFSKVSGNVSIILLTFARTLENLSISVPLTLFGLKKFRLDKVSNLLRGNVNKFELSRVSFSRLVLLSISRTCKKNHKEFFEWHR